VSDPVQVYILTFCRKAELFYGTELIFRTLRVGFPNAHVTVVDNASLPEMREKIQSLAIESACNFRQISGRSVAHHDFLEQTIREVATRGNQPATVVFLDPDLCFWQSCEDFQFDSLIAGKGVSRWYDKLNTVTMPRIHTSFLWIPDVAKLWEAIRRIRFYYFDFQPFLSFSFNMDGVWYRYDTGAGLVNAMPDKVSCFAEEHMERYDHIFAGSHMDWLLPIIGGEHKEMMFQIHQWAKEGNLQALKGIRHRQDEVWEKAGYSQERPPPRAAGTTLAPGECTRG
jgi:hypothetical protein